MASSSGGAGLDFAWFLGASFSGGTDDQSARFVRDCVWENGYSDRYLEDVKSIRSGDRVVLKARYKRKHELPFDNRGHFVSVMAIKATGIVVDNPGDGRHLRVEWTPVDPPREWYFYSYWKTIQKVVSDTWETDALLQFAFEGELQDIDRFRNSPALASKYGDEPQNADRFVWSTFYATFADHLLAYRDDREPLLAAVHELSKLQVPLSVRDRFADGSSGPLSDIDPFTTFGLFNRGITNDNRRRIAESLAESIGVTTSLPASLEGIPVVDNRRSWFFPFAYERSTDHIDVLWQVFLDALNYADSGDADSRQRFASSFDAGLRSSLRRIDVDHRTLLGEALALSDAG